MSRRIMELAGIVHRTDLLKEQDDLFGGGDEGGEDEGGDEGGDDLFGGGEDEEEGGEDEAGGDEGEEGDEGGDAEDAEEPKPPPVTQTDIEKYGSSMDQALTDVFDEIAIKAEKSAVINAPKVDEYSPEATVENIMKRFEQMLFEQEEKEPEAKDSPEETARETKPVDMDVFAREIARLVNNYENLLDMESIIVNHAKRYIVSNYGEEVLVSFEDMLKNRYDINLTSLPEEEAEGTGLLEPVAIGAGGGEGGGGGM